MLNKFNAYILCITSVFIITACQDYDHTTTVDASLPQLQRLASDYTNVHFANNVKVTSENTMLDNNNLHAGGGIAVGDINNDGLQDFVIVSNQEDPGVYLNKGKFKFDDISKGSGLNKTAGWASGIVMEDVNNDGFIDIYISKGIYQHKNASDRKNLLYINNKDNTFTESGEKWGIANTNPTIQSVFFDFDLDGDLDLYLLNQPLDSDQDGILVSELGKRRINNPDKKNSDILYRNEGGHFKDVSKAMGITNWGNGLGIGITDINEDGYPDIYITNDFEIDNFVYLNKSGSKFVEGNKRQIKHQSFFAMGVDIADINNDGRVDIFEVEMLPKERKRTVLNMDSMNPKRFTALLNAGFVPQYMRNSLHLNKAKGRFSEIAQIANVAKTDWSWSTLLVDIDDDGYRDILVTNGITRDIKNRDSVNKGNSLAKKTGGKLSLQQHLDLMESNKIANVSFKNNKDGTFEDKSKEWAFGDKGFSNGFVYGDFDNDGDLDLIVNNIDEKPWIYKNNSVEKGQNTINFKLKGYPKNPNGIGSKVKIYTDGNLQYAEQYVVRGFISSCQPIIHFGLGEYSSIDSLEIIWPDKKIQKIQKPIAANKTHVLNYENAINDNSSPEKLKYIFGGASRLLNLKIPHLENIYDDYAKELLLPHKLSQLGPALATADINGDGIEDIFLGGAADFPAKLFVSSSEKFISQDEEIWNLDSKYEDIAATFFDADGDGDQDLYVGSGSNEFPIGSDRYEDRLYLNNGNGNFSKSANRIPKFGTSTGVVKAADLDGDKDLDLFVGSRLVPGKYPYAPTSYILINENGIFKNKTKDINESIQNIGMVTDANWSDFDSDGDEDLFIVGEWMGINLFRNDNGKLTNISETVGLKDTEGWWFKIQEIDFDQDGDKDYVCGNIGLNHKFKATKEKPFMVYCEDFDNNQQLDIVLAYHQEEKFYPVRGRDCSSEQMPFIKEKFPTFASFGDAQMDDIFGDQLEDAFSLKAKNFASVILENKNGNFVIKELPFDAQISAVRGIEEYDFNNDGFNDLVLAGNMFTTEVETSPADASYGSLLLGDGKGNYKEEYIGKSGFFTPGDVRGIKMINYKDQKLIIVANNNAYLQSFMTKYSEM